MTQGKARFGPLRYSEANRLVVRKYLYDICVQKKMRARHIAEHLDLAVQVVLVPSKSELVAAAVGACDVAVERRADFDYFSTPQSK